MAQKTLEYVTDPIENVWVGESIVLMISWNKQNYLKPAVAQNILEYEKGPKKYRKKYWAESQCC